MLGIKYAITYRRGFTEVRIVTTLGGSDIRPFHRQKRFANTSPVEHGHARKVVRVNDQYRIVFRFEGADAFDVWCTDYH